MNETDWTNLLHYAQGIYLAVRVLIILASLLLGAVLLLCTKMANKRGFFLFCVLWMAEAKTDAGWSAYLTNAWTGYVYVYPYYNGVQDGGPYVIAPGAGWQYGVWNDNWTIQFKWYSGYIGSGTNMLTESHTGTPENPYRKTFTGPPEPLPDKYRSVVPLTNTTMHVIEYELRIYRSSDNSLQGSQSYVLQPAEGYSVTIVTDFPHHWELFLISDLTPLPVGEGDGTNINGTNGTVWPPEPGPIIQDDPIKDIPKYDPATNQPPVTNQIVADRQNANALIAAVNQNAWRDYQLQSAYLKYMTNLTNLSQLTNGLGSSNVWKDLTNESGLGTNALGLNWTNFGTNWSGTVTGWWPNMAATAQTGPVWTIPLEALGQDVGMPLLTNVTLDWANSDYDQYVTLFRGMALVILGVWAFFRLMALFGKATQT